jgi:hypothetical protein
MLDYSYDDSLQRRRFERIRDREPEYVQETMYIQQDNYYESRHDRRKSKVDKFLDDVGLGRAVAAITGQSRCRSQSQRACNRRGSFDSDRSTSTGKTRKKWKQAATASLLTGAVEAWRSRNEPGGMTGHKGKRIATAAISAAGIDAFLDKNPDEKSKRHVVESVIGGLMTNRLANGPRNLSRSRSRSYSRHGYGHRSRSRSHSRFSLRSLSRGPDDSQSRRDSGLKDLKTAGKAFYDRVRSKLRGRDRSLSHSSSEDSFVPTHRQRYRRDRGTPADEYDDNLVDDLRDCGERGGKRR